MVYVINCRWGLALWAQGNLPRNLGKLIWIKIEDTLRLFTSAWFSRHFWPEKANTVEREENPLKGFELAAI